MAKESPFDERERRWVGTIPAHVGAERNISDAACPKKKGQEPKNFRMQIAECRIWS